MAPVASYSPSPLGWSFQSYNLLTLVLSSIFIVCLFVMYSISRTVSVLPHAFRMVTLEKRRMRCFDVDITSGRQAHKVRMVYTWMLRASVLIMFCFVWQYCVIAYKAIDFAQPRGPSQLHIQCVSLESDCFGERYHHKFFDFYANPTNVCTAFKEIANNKMDQVVDEILENYRYLLCMRFVTPDAMVYTAGVAIAFALGYLILTGFEVMVWLLYRATERWLPLLIFTIGIVVFGFWIGSLFIPQFFTFFGCWISFVMVLTIPWILWLALAAAYNLRKLQHQKWALWQEQANRPLEHLVDHSRRSGDPLVDVGGIVMGARGSGEACGGVDMDVEMDDAPVVTASKICNEGQEKEHKHNADSHFDLPSFKGTLYGVKLGLRQKKEAKLQPVGEEQNSPSPFPDGSSTQQNADSSKPQEPTDSLKTN